MFLLIAAIMGEEKATPDFDCNSPLVLCNSSHGRGESCETHTHTHKHPRRVKDIHVTASSFSVIAAVMAEEKAQKFIQEHDPHDAVAYAVNYSAHRQGITPVESTQVYDQWLTYDQVTMQWVSSLSYQRPPSSVQTVAGCWTFWCYIVMAIAMVLLLPPVLLLLSWMLFWCFGCCCCCWRW